jgi:pyrroline-5-carboxylate reductase
MPNTPLLVGRGMSAISPNATATPADRQQAQRLFAAAGRVVVVDESLMDAVTAVSGSGPAYAFYLAEAMIDAGRALGLGDEDASQLAGQTLLGAAAMMLETGIDPAELRRRVTSPGGTTQAAIEHLQAHHVDTLLRDAIGKAAQRSRELGRK